MDYGSQKIMLLGFFIRRFWL